MRVLDSLRDVAADHDALVFDQWGVLHDGARPYAQAVGALSRLKAAGHTLAVLSNSGKRAGPNRDRIEAMGYPRGLFEEVMSSGEALWRDLASGLVSERVFLATERQPGDAARFAEGLDVGFAATVAEAEALLLIGCPDDSQPGDWDDLLSAAAARGLPAYCANPDKRSPRPGGQFAMQPGALAEDYARRGGAVSYYGKPHLPVFRGLERALGLAADRLVLIGDSLEHDIDGAARAGWNSVFVWGGLHRADIDPADVPGSIADLARAHGVAPPTHAIEEVM